MQIKTLEVKNISHYARGSEETPCYNATVYINGKRSIEVSNDGRGGCDMQHAYPSIEDRCLVQQANEWCVEKFGQHTWEHGGKTYSTDNDLEHVCHQALYDWLDSKTLKKDLNTKFLCQEEKEIFAYKKPKGYDEDEFKSVLRNRHPKAKCLNFMPFEDALKLYKEYA
tara:strand:- start:324 stop:827 length:504 start_codon:yes stop_codon:yes gene_type:complete